MKAVILAGGLGSRLRPFTQIIPKPLLPIGEKSVLEVQIEHLKEHGFDEIYLATNYKSQYIENFFGDGSQYGVKLEISKEDKPLGTVGPLTLLKDVLTEPFIFIRYLPGYKPAAVNIEVKGDKLFYVFDLIEDNKSPDDQYHRKREL